MIVKVKSKGSWGCKWERMGITTSRQGLYLQKMDQIQKSVNLETNRTHMVADSGRDLHSGP